MKECVLRVNLYGVKICKHITVTILLLYMYVVFMWF